MGSRRRLILPAVAALLMLLCNCDIDQDQPASVFHGRLELHAGRIYSARFFPGAGDKLSGNMTVVSGGTLGMLLVLDSDSYASFCDGEAYTPLYRQDNAHQVSLVVRFGTPGEHYVVFANTDSNEVTVIVWARMTLE